MMYTVPPIHFHFAFFIRPRSDSHRCTVRMLSICPGVPPTCTRTVRYEYAVYIGTRMPYFKYCTSTSKD